MTEELRSEILPSEPVEVRLTDSVTMRLTPDGENIVSDYIRRQLPPTSYPPISDEERAALLPDIARNADETVTMSLATFANVIGPGLNLFPNAIEDQKLTFAPTVQESLIEE